MIVLELTLEEAEQLSHYASLGNSEYGEDEVANRAIRKLDKAINEATGRDTSTVEAYLSGKHQGAT